MKWKDVDIVIWIDFPFYLTFYQAITRTIKRAYDKKELWPNTGNRESLRRSFFSKDSIVLWTINTYKKTKSKYQKYMDNDNFAHIELDRVCSIKVTKKY